MRSSVPLPVAAPASLGAKPCPPPLFLRCPTLSAAPSACPSATSSSSSTSDCTSSRNSRSSSGNSRSSGSSRGRADGVRGLTGSAWPRVLALQLCRSPALPGAAAGAGATMAAAVSEAAAAATAAEAALPSQQKGWQYTEYGGIENLEFREDLPLPALGPDQVLIKVAAASLNPVDFKRRQGKFAASDSPLPHVPGYDVSGTVAALGPAVTRFKVGDAVYSDVSEAALNQPKQLGSLAQYTAAEERLVALKPEKLTFVQAAAVPLAILTANEAFERAEFKPGQSVLVLNGAGGVGSFAVQLAKKVFGAAFVAATASSSKADLLKDLGVDLVIDYKTQNYWELENKFDFVLDAIGDGPNAVKALKPGGKAKLLTGPVPEGGQAERFVLTSSGAKLEALKPWLESGAVKPILDPLGPFSFQNVKEAFAHLESGHATGKVVIAPVH